MPRSFALSLDAPVAVDEILAAFADDDYWQARLAAFDGGTATLDSLTVDPGGSVTAALTVSLFSNRLPKVVAALAPGNLEMARTETWHPAADGHARGRIDVSVPGAPVSAVGTVTLAPTDAGARLDLQHHRAGAISRWWAARWKTSSSADSVTRSAQFNASPTTGS